MSALTSNQTKNAAKRLRVKLWSELLLAILEDRPFTPLERTGETHKLRQARSYNKPEQLRLI